MGVWERVRGWFGGAGKTSSPRRGRRTYAGAGVSRLFSTWSGSRQSANQEIETSLVRLRARSRQLCRDNPHAAAFLHLLRVNVAGPNGIDLQAQYTSTRGNLNKTFNRALELAWFRWGRPRYASADGRQSWTEILQTIATLEAQDGEVLIRRVRGVNGPFGYTLQLLDPDQLDEQKNEAPINGRPEIRMGIELGAYGRPVAYWIRPNHPNEAVAGDNRAVRVPADEIIHVFTPSRPGAVRGVPWFAPVMVRLHMVDGWEVAALTAAQVGASKMGFFVDKRDEAGEGYEAPTDDDDGSDGQSFTMNVEAGVFGQLPPGMEFQAFDPDYPNVEFEGFERAMLRSVAAGLGVSYTSLASDLTAVNYSSIRSGLSVERDIYRALQQRMIEHVCRPVFDDWLQMATLRRAITPPVLDFEAIGEAMVWNPRGWTWIDPKGDVQAAKEMIALGLASRTKIAAGLGTDFQDNIEQLALEISLAAEAGVPITGLTSQGEHAGGEDGGADDAQDGATDAAANDADRRAPVRLVRRSG